MLRQVLETVNPGVITVEVSAYGIQFREEQGARLLERLREYLDLLPSRERDRVRDEETRLGAFVRPPLEYQVATDYGHEKDVPVHPVDMDLFSFLRLRKADELFGAANLRMLLAPGRGEEVTGGRHNEEAMVRLFARHGIKPGGYTIEMLIRDMFMIRKIQVLMKRYGSHRFLHITGWRHLQDPYNLFLPLHPTRILCHDETLCF